MLNDYDSERPCLKLCAIHTVHLLQIAKLVLINNKAVEHLGVHLGALPSTFMLESPFREIFNATFLFLTSRPPCSCVFDL
jgi:hypothetical protein